MVPLFLSTSVLYYCETSFYSNKNVIKSMKSIQAGFIANSAAAATGIYLPPYLGSESFALLVRTPRANATDAYYQELLGISVTTMLSLKKTVSAYSDCSSAIQRAQ
jgi:hypothetical protein